MFIRLDLPEPLVPRIASISPDNTRSDTPRRAGTFTSPVSYTLVTLSRVMSTPNAVTLFKWCRRTGANAHAWANRSGNLDVGRLVEQARGLRRRSVDDQTRPLCAGARLPAGLPFQDLVEDRK